MDFFQLNNKRSLSIRRYILATLTIDDLLIELEKHELTVQTFANGDNSRLRAKLEKAPRTYTLDKSTRT